ncbi:Uncharacterized protein APZ42_030901 [Daphnia magna]|uniref:Uncharacterized protein n=1 Tax=Daphnia magna TaxID=35525 RepID=A0A164NFN2_9CRUS|nr:Uncharacterized protein APZ42_030901 [Daphnia magna]
MMDTDVIAQHYTKMVVLGGAFQIGDLYDYRNDRIVTGRQCWDSDEIARASTIRDQFTLKIKSPDSGSTSNKRENVGLDEHLQASVMAGLIEKYRGAAKYLSNRASPLEASQVLICRAKSRKVSLDLQTLMSQDVPHLVESKNEVESSTSKTLPTHVVVGVTYGAEAYCVLALESDEHAQEKDQEYLSEIASKMEAALSKSLDFYGFKDLFNEEERKQLTRIKCRLYVDLQTSPFQEGSVFSTFKQCHKLIEQVRKGDIRNKKIVPIAVLLCPLKAIMGPAVGVYPEYQDVDSELLDRCCRTWEALDSICANFRQIQTAGAKSFWEQRCGGTPNWQ